MRDVGTTIKRYIHRAIAHLVAVFLRSGALFDPENFRLWERRGYHIIPIHFYYPIPDTRDLERKDFQPSDCPGIDLHPELQLKLLKDSLAKFSQECNTFPIKPTDPNVFYLENDTFNGIDPYIYYCMIRHFKPKAIMEIGSGHSTVLGAQACQLNGATHYICIDPWPNDSILKGIRGIEFIRQKVEDIDLNIFQHLQQNDFLFVDASHVVRTKGDVCFMILEVLPRLAQGVIIHFHDIFLPSDYPKEWLVERQYFWTEQYLLQAYLIENCHAEVLFANHFISKNHTEEVRQIFPNAIQIRGQSLWIRKI